MPALRLALIVLLSHVATAFVARPSVSTLRSYPKLSPARQPGCSALHEVRPCTQQSNDLPTIGLAVLFSLLGSIEANSQYGYRCEL